MRILLATGAPTLPQMIGGSQRTGDTLLRELQKRGHEVALSAGLVGRGWLGWRGRALMKLTGRRAIVDRSLGYRVYRSWFPYQTAIEVTRRFRPDIVIVQAHATGAVARSFKATGIPILLSFQDVEFQEHADDLRELEPIAAVANSRFTAAAYERNFDVRCTVIHPLIYREEYEIPDPATDRETVTFINPAPVKGLDLAIAIAALLPDIPFRFQLTWPMSDDQQAALRQRLAATSNVTLHPQVENMRQIYEKTRIMLVPSQWNEGYGRVASEAQFAGIPVVGSDRGGLPEAIGDGGVVLSADASANEWAATIAKLWRDKASYEELSEKARRHVARAALNLERQIDAWETAAKDLCRVLVAD